MLWLIVTAALESGPNMTAIVATVGGDYRAALKLRENQTHHVEQFRNVTFGFETDGLYLIDCFVVSTKPLLKFVLLKVLRTNMKSLLTEAGRRLLDPSSSNTHSIG